MWTLLNTISKLQSFVHQDYCFYKALNSFSKTDYKQQRSCHRNIIKLEQISLKMVFLILVTNAIQLKLDVCFIFIILCITFAYDWMVKDEWKVTCHDPKLDIVRSCSITKNFFLISLVTMVMLFKKFTKIFIDNFN